MLQNKYIKLQINKEIFFYYFPKIWAENFCSTETELPIANQTFEYLWNNNL